MNYEELINVRNEKNNFAKENGIYTTEISEGYAKAEIELVDKHQNYIGSVHGGCIFTLADTVAGAAASSHGDYMTTISGSINYLSPAMNTNKLIAEAREIKKGKKICVYDVDIMNDTNEVLAKGSFSYFNLGKKIKENN